MIGHGKRLAPSEERSITKGGAKKEAWSTVKDKVVLITGGTGSFGRWFTKELLKYDPEEICIYSRDEEKQLRMSIDTPDTRIRYVIGDVRDYTQILEATKGVHLLYHAAALKLIPTGEQHPLEVIKTNIFGTWNVKRAAIENKVEKAILISTDKAVKPVNLYGMTKAIAEKCWIADEHNARSKFAVVRYGNVIGSRGSVIPHFRRLIGENKPLPLTHPGMTRFLITLQHATDLVLYATENMKGGEVYVPRIPACKIVDLAQAMAGEDYPIETVGIRPGEKLHECLISEDELSRTKETEKHYVIHSHEQHKLGRMTEEYTTQSARQLSREEIVDLLRESGWL